MAGDTELKQLFELNLIMNFPTPEELKEFDRERDFERQKYDPFENVYQVAKCKGLTVLLPKDNELFIDIDSDKQFNEFCDRLQMFMSNMVCNVKEVPSPSGLPHRHIIVEVEGKTFTNHERLALQSALNTDPTLSWLNVLRAEAGFEPCVCFFQPK